MKSLIVTDSGNELIAKVIAGETTISFTRIAVSDRDYSEIDVKQIKDLQQIKQTVPISKISRIDKNMIEVLAAVENRQVEEPYFVYALGIYAKDSNENEILYGVSLCDENPDYMPAYEGKVLSGISYRLDIVVGDSEQVVLDVNPAAVATVLQVEQIENDLIRHTQDREIHVTEEKQKKWDAVEDKVDKLEAAEIKMLGWSVPRECVIQNEINGNKFIQKSGRIDLGDVEWSYYSERGHEGLRGKNPGNLKAVSNNSYVANIYTSVYETSTADNAYNHTKDKIIGVNTSGYISVYDSSYTDVDTFKTAMQGQYLYYELATPITKTIDGNELSTTKADKTEVPKLVKVDNKTVFLSEDGVLSAKGGESSIIVTFADGTDEEIAAMIDAHYNNKINIADYWAVGDKRKVSLSAMSATGVSESHRAQTVEFAIADFDHDDLTTAINGHTKAAVTLTQVNCLMDAECAAGTKYGSNNTEKGYMNRSQTNAGGWESCARRTWCNSVYYNALPFAFKNIVKEVNKKTSAGNKSATIKTTADKIFLLSEIEIFGSEKMSAAGEGNQYQYYKNATANIYKLPKWNSSSNTSTWWLRSPHLRYDSFVCGVSSDGYMNSYDVITSYGIVPCLCL